MGREGHYVIAQKRLDEGLHHQNSLKSVLEREGDISSTLYTKWRALYIKCMYIHTYYIHIHRV